MRIVSACVIALVAALALGQVSGNQPERDAVEASRAELGIALESRRIDVGEISLHVVLAGPSEGPPVVLLHGFPEFWYAWRGPMAVLARAGFRVIVPDQRGYNRSDKPAGAEAYRLDRRVGDVVGLMDALDLDSAHVAAQDVGGGVGWRLVLEHPERVRSYAVISVPHPLAYSAFDGEVDEVSWHRTFMRIPWLPGFSARVANWWLLTSNLRATSAPGTFPEEEMDLLRSAWDRDGAAYSMTAQWRASDWPYEGDGRIARPVLVIFAPGDVYFTEQVTRLSLRFLDAGELVELDSGTHWVGQEQPERIGAILAGFFGRAR
jgi:pimeloyl-ACP methyl ester carboxylesterase